VLVCGVRVRLLRIRTELVLGVEFMAGVIGTARSMRSRICPSVCLFRHSTAAATCGGFAAERRADRRYRSTFRAR